MTLRRSGKRSDWRIGTTAMLVMAACGSASFATTPQFSAFSPPQAPLLLIRTLYRPLPGGQAIVTRRSYSVRIVPDGAGYRVEGQLLQATVEAPPKLAAMAEIERRRPDSGLFPILLDSQGQILGGGNVLSDGSLEHAAVVAAESIGGSGLSAIDMLQAQAFVKHLANRTPRSQWPADVFNPVPGRRNEARVIALPGGSEGRVTIGIASQGVRQDGQLALLERVVTTDLDGDIRVTREQWQLSKPPRSSER